MRRCGSWIYRAKNDFGDVDVVDADELNLRSVWGFLMASPLIRYEDVPFYFYHPYS